MHHHFEAGRYPDRAAVLVEHAVDDRDPARIARGVVGDGHRVGLIAPGMTRYQRVDDAKYPRFGADRGIIAGVEYQCVDDIATVPQFERGPAGVVHDHVGDHAAAGLEVDPVAGNI